MEFTEKELKTALLLGTGKSETETAKLIGRSRSWVQRLKKKEGFKRLIERHTCADQVEDLIEKTKPEFIKNAIKRIASAELAQTKDQSIEAYSELVRDVQDIRDLLKIKIYDHINKLERIPPHLIGQYARIYKDLSMIPITISKLIAEKADPVYMTIEDLNNNPLEDKNLKRLELEMDSEKEHKRSLHIN